MTAAFLAVGLALGTWIGFRLGEETRRTNDLTDYLLSIPPTEWDDR